jgi:hypothetical protein
VLSATSTRILSSLARWVSIGFSSDTIRIGPEVRTESTKCHNRNKLSWVWGVLPQVGETKLVLFGGGYENVNYIIKGCRGELTTPAATKGVYGILGRNASKRSQVFAPVATGCNLRESHPASPLAILY